jgi:hypothetical protein
MRGSGWTPSIMPNGDDQTVYVVGRSTTDGEEGVWNPIVHGHGFQLATLEYSITWDRRNSAVGAKLKCQH